MTVDSREELLQEISFIGYYFHWSQEEILRLPHLDRRRYCEEINRINRKVNGENNLFRV
ncbi:MAG: hypothetical protein K2P87_10780 [Lachnospiraceae bacterium]|nr:hypothetical protein [Lachnospiraceae bacterium]